MAKILVVDDEELARVSLRDVLEGEGHEVIEAANGKQALAMFETGQPDLVVTDMIMPEKEGVETIVEIKRISPTTPILAISGSGRTKNMDFLDLARQYGVQRTLPKPFSANELVEAVRALLK